MNKTQSNYMFQTCHESCCSAGATGCTVISRGMLCSTVRQLWEHVTLNVGLYAPGSYSDSALCIWGPFCKDMSDEKAVTQGKSNDFASLGLW